MVLALVLALFQLTSPDTTEAPPEAGVSVRSKQVGSGIEVNYRALLNSFVSSSKGFGVGVEAIVSNIGTAGTELRVSAEPAQRFGRYRASFFSGDPFAVPVYAGVSGEWTVNQVRGFYGVGPSSSRDNQVFASLKEIEAGFRVGWYPFGAGRVLVQPAVRLLHAEVRSFRNRDDGAFQRLDPASQRSLFSAVERPSTGVTYGLEIAVDRRDRLFYSSRGVLGILTARRYDGIGGRRFNYWSGTASVYGFIPLPMHRHILFTRTVVALTRRIGDEPLPFYALPLLDDQLLGAYTRYRFNGNDLLALTLGWRFPVYTFLDWFAFDANVQVSAANAYNNLFDQFEPGLSFSSDLSDEGRRVPLRPALSVGLRIVDLDEDRVIIGGQVGIDPEGYKFGSLRVVYGIRDVRPLVR
ncbi:MAG: hypothetical protein AAGI91_07285 [Bacteroidota bacterium]